MIDLIKKAMFTGVGLVALTKEKIEEIGKEFIEKGKMSEAEGKKFVDELVERSDASKEAIRRQIDERIRLALEKMNVAKKTDVDELKAEIGELKAALTLAAEGVRIRLETDSAASAALLQRHSASLRTSLAAAGVPAAAIAIARHEQA